MPQAQTRSFTRTLRRTATTAGTAILVAGSGGVLGAMPVAASAEADATTDATGTLTAHANVASTCDGTGTSCTWMGYTWNTLDSNCHVGGSRLCNNVANETVDANGYLHLSIAQVGTTWYAAQVWTQNNFGFGTFNIIVQADPSVFAYSGNTTSWNDDTCFSPFLYGPLNDIGTDGSDEIDFAEFTSFGDPTLQNLDFAVYPAAGSGETKHHVKRWIIPDNPTLVTVRVTWSSTSVTMTLYDGAVPLGQTGTVLVSQNYVPADPSAQIPQTALPMVLNIRPYKLKSGFVQQEVIVQSFEYEAQ